MRKNGTEEATWPIARLKPHPSQARVFDDTPEPEFLELKADIEKNGLRHRVEILPTTGVIVCGHRRVRALRLLGCKEVPVLILYDLAARGEAAVRQRLITDNLLRRQLTPLGKVRGYVELVQALVEERGGRWPSGSAQGELRERLGKILGQSGRNVDRYLAVARLPMPIQQAFDDGQLSLVQAARIATLPAEAQERIAAAVEQGAPAREAVADHLPAADGRHKKAGDALASLVRALGRGIADLQGRDDQVRSPRGEDVVTLTTARDLIDELLRRTRCPV
jgi:ParB family chromosome partitioning protein